MVWLRYPHALLRLRTFTPQLILRYALLRLRAGYSYFVLLTRLNPQLLLVYTTLVVADYVTLRYVCGSRTTLRCVTQVPDVTVTVRLLLPLRFSVYLVGLVVWIAGYATVARYTRSRVCRTFTLHCVYTDGCVCYTPHMLLLSVYTTFCGLGYYVRSVDLVCLRFALLYIYVAFVPVRVYAHAHPRYVCLWTDTRPFGFARYVTGFCTRLFTLRLLDYAHLWITHVMPALRLHTHTCPVTVTLITLLLPLLVCWVALDCVVAFTLRFAFGLVDCILQLVTAHTHLLRCTIPRGRFAFITARLAHFTRFVWLLHAHTRLTHTRTRTARLVWTFTVTVRLLLILQLLVTLYVTLFYAFVRVTVARCWFALHTLHARCLYDLRTLR